MPVRVVADLRATSLVGGGEVSKSLVVVTAVLMHLAQGEMQRGAVRLTELVVLERRVDTLDDRAVLRPVAFDAG